MPWENIICYLPNVKSVIYTDNCNDIFLHCVAKFCPIIEIINISYSYVSDDGIKNLCCSENGTAPCPMLKKVITNGTRAVKEGIKFLLKNLPFVEIVGDVRLGEVLYSIHKYDLNVLDKIKPYCLTNLSLINVIQNYDTDFRNEDNERILDDMLKICIFVCPRLKSFNCPIAKQEHLELCSRLSKLEKVSYKCLNKTAINIDEFLKLRGSNLEYLSLINFSMTATIMLQNCPQLEKLFVKEITFLPDCNFSMFVLPNLEQIWIDSFYKKDAQAVRALSRLLLFCPKLKELRFIYCTLNYYQIGAEILKCCDRCKLKRIGFEHCVVAPRLLYDILLTCLSLESLNVAECFLCSMSFVRYFNTSSVFERLESIASSLPNRPEIGTDYYQYLTDVGCDYFSWK